MSEPQQLTDRAQRVAAQVGAAVMGKQAVIESALAALLSGGHLLIEDIPGVGKTTLAKALARALGCGFRRIQFTPDLLPADVTGTSVFNQKAAEFEFRPGPVFTNILLADEINRATPKSQSALLECMEEGQVTVDGVTHRLPEPFFVIATQNNIEMAGTYPLPEAQLDRFTARITMGYPSLDAELAILTSQQYVRPVDSLEPVVNADEVVELQRGVRDVHTSPAVYRYVLDVVTATRTHPAAALGASPRGSLCLVHTAQARALVLGRRYVIPDDVKAVAGAVLAHRIIMRPEQRLRGASPVAIVEEALQRVPVPVDVRTSGRG